MYYTGKLKCSYIFLFFLIFLSCKEQNVVEDLKATPGVITEDSKEILAFAQKMQPESQDRIEVVTLTNDGGFPISNLSFDALDSPVEFLGGEYPGDGGSCGDSLDSQQSCQVVFKIATTQEITKDITLTLRFNDGIDNSAKKIPLSFSILSAANLVMGVGSYTSLEELAADIKSQLKFPITKLGETKVEIITLGNTGSRELTQLELDGVNYTGGDFPGINGNCMPFLAAKSICQIEVFYQPVEEEKVISYINFDFYDSFDSQSINASILFEAVDERAKLTFDVSNLYNLGEIVEGRTETKQIRVYNNTVVDATLLEVSLGGDNKLSFAGGTDYPGNGGDCDNQTIGAFSSCSLVLDFSSDTLGEVSQKITLKYYDNNEFDPKEAHSELTFSATVLSPGLVDVETTSEAPKDFNGDFGTIEFNTSKIKRLYLKNIEEFDVTFNSFEITEDNNNAFSINSSSNCIAKNPMQYDDSCYVEIKADNTASAVGEMLGKLKVIYNNGKEDVTLEPPLSVKYVKASDLVLLGTFSFGDVAFVDPANTPNTVEKVLTLKNQGDGDAKISSIELAPPNLNFEITYNGCQSQSTSDNFFELKKDEQCTIGLKYTANSLGYSSTKIEIDWEDDLDSDEISRQVSAYAKLPANILIQDRSGGVLPVDLSQSQRRDLGRVNPGNSKDFYLKLYNEGDIKADALTLTIDPSSDHYTIEKISCQSLTNIDLSSNGDCSFKLTYTPSSPGADPVSPDPVNLKVEYNNGSETVSQEFYAKATGEASGHLIIESPALPIDFGDVIQGNDKEVTVTFKNVGGGNVSGLNLEDNGIFTWETTNPCSSTIEPNGTCQVELNFKPTSNNFYSKTLFYTYNIGGGVDHENFFDAAGRGKSPPNINVGVTQHDFGKTPLNQQKEISLTINNTGQTSTTIDSFTISSSFSLGGDCSVGTVLEQGNFCNLKIYYTPTAEGEIEQTMTISFSNTDDKTIILKGEGIVPDANFSGWSLIYAVSDHEKGEFKLKWDSFNVTDSNTIITGHNVYVSDNEITLENLNDENSDLTKYILSSTSRVFVMSDLTPGSIKYIAIRATYAGGEINSQSDKSHLKVIIPPVNMALVHPYMINSDFCSNMGIIIDSDKDYGCAYNGKGSIQMEDGTSYYNFNNYLFIDRYELSINNSVYESLPDKQPANFVSPQVAQNACKSVSSVTIGDQTYSKQLVRRSEHIAASAWDDSLSRSDISDIEESGTQDNCVVGVNSKETASASNCISKFGVYDLVGNLWEWSNETIMGSIGIGSRITGISNSDFVGLNFTNFLENYLYNYDCFDFHIGVVQSNLNCSLAGSSGITPDINVLGNNFFISTFSSDGQKKFGVRNGGGVGNESGSAGRWTVDLSKSFGVNPTAVTGARCSIRIPFNQ